MTINATQPADFPATTSQLYKVSEIRQNFDDLTKFMPSPVEGEIRLAGTRRKYKVRIGLYAIPPRTVGLDIWAPSDEARLRIGQHRDMWGRINVVLGDLKFDAALGTFVKP